jgi:hypothetical protein
MNIFFAQRQCSNVPGISDRKDLKPTKITFVAVLGGGKFKFEIIKRYNGIRNSNMVIGKWSQSNFKRNKREVCRTSKKKSRIKYF